MSFAGKISVGPIPQLLFDCSSPTKSSMIQRVRSWLILFSCVCLVSTTVGAPSLADLRERRIAKARLFVVGDWTGPFGGPSFEQRQLALLLKEPDAASRMRRILATGTPEGQMFGLYGLRRLRDPAFESYASALEHSTGAICTTSLVIGFHKSKAEVVNRIRENYFRGT